MKTTIKLDFVFQRGSSKIGNESTSHKIKGITIARFSSPFVQTSPKSLRTIKSNSSSPLSVSPKCSQIQYTEYIQIAQI